MHDIEIRDPRQRQAKRNDLRAVNHSYEGLMEGLAGGIFPGNAPWIQAPITGQNPLFENSGATMLTLNRQLLANSYKSGGIEQKIIDVPVDDAFKGGVTVKCDELDEDDLKLFNANLKKWRVIRAIKQGMKLGGRLNGGGGLIIATDQDPLAPFDVSTLAKDERIAFIPVDRWELTNQILTPQGYPVPQPYFYYTQRIDWSRVIRIMGRDAPSFLRPRLSGWGFSELERCLPDINQFYQLRTVIFELVNQAKIDVLKLQGLNDLLMTSDGTQKAIMRVMIANMIKSYKAALVLDQTDEYEQKTQTFGGLADLLEQAMICLSGSTGIPVPKLFGIATTGFGSGEDQQENYNALVEADVREPCQPLLHEVFSVCMQVTFGYVPDFDTEFSPMRESDPVEDEAVKTSKQARILALRTADQISGEEADELLHKEGLLDIDTEVGRGERDPSPEWEQSDETDGEEDPKDEKKTKKPAAEDHSREGMRQKAQWLNEHLQGRSFKRWYARKNPNDVSTVRK